MALDVLLAVLSGFFLGRGLANLRGGDEKEAAAEATVIMLEVPPENGPADLQQAILDVLSGSGEAMTLAEIAAEMEREYFAPLIRPMRSLLKMGRVVKEDKAYRFV